MLSVTVCEVDSTVDIPQQCGSQLVEYDSGTIVTMIQAQTHMTELHHAIFNATNSRQLFQCTA